MMGTGRRAAAVVQRIQPAAVTTPKPGLRTNVGQGTDRASRLESIRAI